MYELIRTDYWPDGASVKVLVRRGPRKKLRLLALLQANNMADSLNKHSDPGVSFGVVEDEDGDTVTVNYYYLEDETDTTGNTKKVSVYKVKAI